MTEVNRDLQQGKIEIGKIAEYQEGKIVKHQLYNSTNTNIVLAAFSRGQEMKPHSSPMDAVLQVIDGEGVIHLDGRDNIVKKGEIILLPANIPHGLKAEVNFQVLIVKIAK